MKSKIATLLFLACFLNGCATTQSSGPANTYISTSAPLNQIKTAIIQVYTSDGWRLERESDHMISFTVEDKNPLSQFLFSSNYDSRVIVRESVTIMDNQGGTTLSANQERVTNYGSAFERTTSIDSPKSEQRLFQIKMLLSTKS